MEHLAVLAIGFGAGLALGLHIAENMLATIRGGPGADRAATGNSRAAGRRRPSRGLRVIARLRVYLARRKCRRQIRQLERCLAVLRPLLSKPALSLEEVMARHETFVNVAMAESCLVQLRERV